LAQAAIDEELRRRPLTRSTLQTYGTLDEQTSNIAKAASLTCYGFTVRHGLSCARHGRTVLATLLTGRSRGEAIRNDESRIAESKWVDPEGNSSLGFQLRHHQRGDTSRSCDLPWEPLAGCAA
jgi:hypothetical protein